MSQTSQTFPSQDVDEILNSYLPKMTEEKDENGKVIKRTKKTAKKLAIEAAQARVSRRLLMVERAAKITLVCPVTGIISLLEITTLPGKFLHYEHPLSNLETARDIVQEGSSYLWKLETQILAGLLIVISQHYDHFEFSGFNHGAEKNALLRTAGKELLIDSLVLFERFIHSRSLSYIPKLKISPEIATTGDGMGMGQVLFNHLKMFAEAVQKPDLSTYDENVKPKRVGTIPYISIERRKEKKREEILLQNDKKKGKELISILLKEGKINKQGSEVLKHFLDQLVEMKTEDRDKIVLKLEDKNSEAASELAKIFKNPRTFLNSLLSGQEIENIDLEDSETADEESDSKESEISDNKETPENEMEMKKQEIRKAAEEIPFSSPFEKMMWIKRRLKEISNS